MTQAVEITYSTIVSNGVNTVLGKARSQATSSGILLDDDSGVWSLMRDVLFSDYVLGFLNTEV